MKIVVDTNIVFSSILSLSGRIGKILLLSKGLYQFYTCNFLQFEMQKHRSRLLALSKLPEQSLDELLYLVTKNIQFIDEGLIPKELLLNTEQLLQDIDPADTHS